MQENELNRLLSVCSDLGFVLFGVGEGSHRGLLSPAVVRCLFMCAGGQSKDFRERAVHERDDICGRLTPFPGWS